MNVLLLVVVGITVILQLPTEGMAECCHGYTPIPYATPTCGDCTVGTPYCAHGPCNVFGCNCDGGCRTGSCAGRRRGLGTRDVISEADVDGDGRMSMKEARALLADKEFPADRVYRELREMDLDNDHFLSPGEIDRDFV